MEDAQLLEDVEAIHVRQAEIQDEEVVLVAAGTGESLGPRRDDVDGIARVLESTGDKIRDTAVVFGNENSAHEVSRTFVVVGASLALGLADVWGFVR